MKIFLDTTVLVAASASSHPHHRPSFEALRRVAAGQDGGFMSVHLIAEVYATLTRLPIEPRMHPIEASRIVSENLLPNLAVIPIDKVDYLNALRIVSDGGWPGAKIYDALLLSCASKCGAERIYTLNLKDFKLLAAADLQGKICAP